MAVDDKTTDETTGETTGERETGRLEAFSDGVFAIAITLLILEIDVPLHSTHLFHDILHTWPSFLAYVLSFAVILIMWINHHTVFRLITRIDRRFLMINGILLMLITFLNYPTAVLADYLTTSHAGSALLLYDGTFVFISLTFNALWRYAAHNGRLLGAEVKPETVAAITRAYRRGPFFYTASFLAAFVSVPLSVAINIGLAIYFAVYGL
jgi:uncharacterized membrane protein